MSFREGDIIETGRGELFDVKGLVHPRDRVIAFIRYFPKRQGARQRTGIHYEKVYSFDDRYRVLKERFPHYLVNDPVFDETLCEVPKTDIKKHFDPATRLQELRSSKKQDALEALAVETAGLVQEEAHIPWKEIGITGSVMIGLHTTRSDIDIVVYGSDNCRKAHHALTELLENCGGFRSYNEKEIRTLFEFRSRDTHVGYKDFVRTESRKSLEGKFKERDYFIRFVKNPNEDNEKYGDVCFENMGYATIKCTVRDDSESIFTPCTYEVDRVRIQQGPKVSDISQIVSFRGRFCEQARNGEAVVAHGKIERVTDLKRDRKYSRLLLGNKPEDFMALLPTLLNQSEF